MENGVVTWEEDGNLLGDLPTQEDELVVVVVEAKAEEDGEAEKRVVFGKSERD